jgi:hypothetical protein
MLNPRKKNLKERIMKYLIIPAAGQSSRYPNLRPKWLLTMPDGKLMIEKCVSYFNSKNFNKIFIVVLKEHVTKFTNKKLLTQSLKKNIGKNVEIVELEKKTTCQAETVINCLKKTKIIGSILIKDCDNQFYIEENFFKNKISNIVGAIDINTQDFIDAKNKSYIEFNKKNIITNIVEKKIISDFFCAGAYGFSNSDAFKLSADKLLKKSKDVYISHVIFDMMLSGVDFRYKKVKQYVDWGTVREFRNYKKKTLTIFCDFDGCLVYNGSKFGKKGWQTNAITENMKKINEFQKKKSITLIITTSRPRSQVNYIKRLLKCYQINYSKIITDLPHSKRILINDFYETNPYPSAIAININRNSNKLGNYLLSLD